MSDKEYDDENRGAVFPPFPDQNYILQGELDIEQDKHKVVVVKGKTQKGIDIVKFYTELCAIFPNDNNNANAPDYTGKLDEKWEYKNNRIAAWVKESNGKKYMSLELSEPHPALEVTGPKENLDNTQEKSDDSSAKNIDDEIPF